MKVVETSREEKDRVIQDDHEAICDDFLDAFMKGNFSRVQRSMEKLDQIKTQNIRQLLTN
jgi:hypothetical protein